MQTVFFFHFNKYVHFPQDQSGIDFFPLTGHKMERNWTLYFLPSEFGDALLQART